jgi:hypothetical protein
VTRRAQRWHLRPLNIYQLEQTLALLHASYLFRFDRVAVCGVAEVVNSEVACVEDEEEAQTEAVAVEGERDGRVGDTVARVIQPAYKKMDWSASPLAFHPPNLAGAGLARTGWVA